MSTETVNLLITIGVSLIAGFATALLTIGKYRQKVDGVIEDVKELQVESKSEGKKLAKIEGRIDTITLNRPESFIKRESPVSLNDLGKEALKESGASTLIDAHLKELSDKVKEMQPKTAYDVQEMSRNVMESVANSDLRFVALKDYAFKQGLDLSILTLIAGIALRDKLIPMLHFDYGDLDTTAPASHSRPVL